MNQRTARGDRACALSLPRTGQPGQLGTRDIARIVARHAQAADLPEDRPLATRAAPHVLHAPDTAADTVVIRELAGHADIRTTTIYTVVSATRLEHAVAERAQQRQGASRAAAERAQQRQGASRAAAGR